MKVDLVFEGGGILGISFVGAITCLKQYGYQINRCAGTSAGAIVASLLIAGYDEKELWEIIVNLNYEQFNKSSYGPGMSLPKVVSLLKNKGLYNSNNIETWISPLLEKKGVTKFKDVIKNRNSSLKIVASDITRRDMLILPDDLVKYNIEPGEFNISRAVAMSSSIPFYFTPQILKEGRESNYIVDGGLLSNFPIWIFDVEGIPQWPTFGFKLRDKESMTMQGKGSFIAYANDVITAPLNINSERFIRDTDSIRTITIDIPGIKAVDFQKAYKYKDEMFKNGYEATEKFLQSWSFNRYVSEYRMKMKSLKKV